ncbi:MAG: hypothetical protein AAFP00_13980, partial [Bacteroidota bacterium]
YSQIYQLFLLLEYLDSMLSERFPSENSFQSMKSNNVPIPTTLKKGCSNFGLLGKAEKQKRI